MIVPAGRHYRAWRWATTVSCEAAVDAGSLCLAARLDEARTVCEQSLAGSDEFRNWLCG
jgi:hypothetical protein